MRDNEETGCCGICGVDPIEHECVKVGITHVDMCGECYEEFEMAVALFRSATSQAPCGLAGNSERSEGIITEGAARG